jgi:NAD(P)H-dependent flavin oxidoreductase YrpB (nitropropane dioxygenase family)
MEWNTRVTALLGSRYPIIQGAFGTFGTSAIAAPTSEAGGFGLITASALETPEGLRDDIRRARSMTDKPFGVNLSIGTCPRIDEQLEICIEEEVTAVETAAYRGDQYGIRLKEAGVKWIHKVVSVRHAIAAERHGADAVVILGLEGVSFKSPIQLPTLIGIPLAARQIEIPIIASGGIGDARGFLAALAMGAEAVCLGSVFVATKECPTSDGNKQTLVDGDPSDPAIRDRVLASHDPRELEKVMALRDSVPTHEWLQRLESVRMGGTADERLDMSHMPESEAMQAGGASLAVGTIDKVVSVKELIDGIIQGAEEILTSQPFAGFWQSAGLR